MTLIPVFQNLDYSARVIKPNVTYSVDRLTHHTLGGPRRADISVKGTAADMWEFAEYIGCPVTIYDDVGRTVWWGYVHEFKASRKGARLYCRGWWERVSWRYYLNSGTNTVETTTQIAAIITNMAPFITATDILDASGISTLETRDGKRRGSEEIEELLNAGTSSGYRLLGKVDESRRFGVYIEPLGSSVEDYWLTGDVEFGASLDTMANKVYATWTAPGSSNAHNTATYSDTDSQAAYGQKSEQLTLSAADATLAAAACTAELARRKYPIPTISVLDGKISNFSGIPIPDYMVRAAHWLRLKDVIPQSVDTTRLADITKIFIEEVEWSRTGGLRITPRDVPSRYQGGAL